MGKGSDGEERKEERNEGGRIERGYIKQLRMRGL